MSSASSTRNQVPMFSGNWTQWSSRMRMHLKSRELWTVVEQDVLNDGKASEAQIKRNYEALDTLLTGLPDDAGGLILDMESAFHAWAALEAVYKMQAHAARDRASEVFQEYKMPAGMT